MIVCGNPGGTGAGSLTFSRMRHLSVTEEPCARVKILLLVPDALSVMVGVPSSYVKLEHFGLASRFRTAARSTVYHRCLVEIEETKQSDDAI